MSERRTGAAAAAIGRIAPDSAVRDAREIAHSLAGRFREHSLYVYSSAIAFRALVALVPLTLLGLGLLGALGEKDVWRDTIAPAFKDRFTPPVYHAIDSSAEKILSSGTAGLIAFASALLFWNVVAAVMVVMSALSRIHNVEEQRRRHRRITVAAALSLVVVVCVLGSILEVVLLGRVDAGGAGNALLAVVKWVVAVGLLGLAIGTLVRYAPAERPEARWASAGSITIIVGWIVTSLAFRWWVTTVANFKTAIGQLTFFLLLTAYVAAVSIVFLIGVELDELMRKRAERS